MTDVKACPLLFRSSVSDWDLRDHLQNPKPRNPEKSQKSLPRGVRDPWPRTPKKVPKKVRKVKKIVDFDYFLDFSDFLGGPGSGVPNSSRETFLRLFGVSGFWVLLTSVDGRGDPKSRTPYSQSMFDTLLQLPHLLPHASLVLWRKRSNWISRLLLPLLWNSTCRRSQWSWKFEFLSETWWAFRPTEILKLPHPSLRTPSQPVCTPIVLGQDSPIFNKGTDSPLPSLNSSYLSPFPEQKENKEISERFTEERCGGFSVVLSKNRSLSSVTNHGIHAARDAICLLESIRQTSVSNSTCHSSNLNMQVDGWDLKHYCLGFPSTSWGLTSMETNATVLGLMASPRGATKAKPYWEAWSTWHSALALKTFPGLLHTHDELK